MLGQARSWLGPGIKTLYKGSQFLGLNAPGDRIAIQSPDKLALSINRWRGILNSRGQVSEIGGH